MDFAEAERVVNDAARRVESYTREALGVTLDLGGVDVVVTKLPTAYEGSGRVRKTLGMYVEGDNKYYIDPVLIDESDPERALFGDDLPDIKRVAGEELLHYVQHATGAMRRYKRKFCDAAPSMIEGAASSTADELFGQTRIYEREKDAYRELVAEVGEEAAFLGFPEADKGKVYRLPRIEEALKEAA